MLIFWILIYVVITSFLHSAIIAHFQERFSVLCLVRHYYQIYYKSSHSGNREADNLAKAQVTDTFVSVDHVVLEEHSEECPYRRHYLYVEPIFQMQFI